LSYEHHPDLVTPPDETVVWRFMDFPKFIQLLETSSLWFSRADIFEDPLEAGFTDGELLKLNSQRVTPDEQHIRRAMVKMPAYMRVTGFVNCWRAGQDESMAMWDLYGKAGGSVAIKSTIGRLKESAALASQKIFIGEVRYVDWRESPFDNNVLVMCVRKTLSYRHECEIRMLIWAHDFVQDSSALIPQGTGGTWEAGLIELKKRMPLGISVPVDLHETITEVVVGPREPTWVASLVSDVLKRYNLRRSIVVSDLLKSRV
jgi:hypothetical protein